MRTRPIIIAVLALALLAAWACAAAGTKGPDATTASPTPTPTFFQGALGWHTLEALETGIRVIDVGALRQRPVLAKDLSEASKSPFAAAAVSLGVGFDDVTRISLSEDLIVIQGQFSGYDDEDVRLWLSDFGFHAVVYAGYELWRGGGRSSPYGYSFQEVAILPGARVAGTSNAVRALLKAFRGEGALASTHPLVSELGPVLEHGFRYEARASGEWPRLASLAFDSGDSTTSVTVHEIIRKLQSDVPQYSEDEIVQALEKEGYQVDTEPPYYKGERRSERDFDLRMIR